MLTKKFIIKTEKGFYNDFFSKNIFTDIQEKANKFDSLGAAVSILDGLKMFGHCKEGTIVNVTHKRTEAEELAHLLALAAQVVEEAEENAAANPTSEEIQIVIVEPMKKPYKKVIPNKLEAFQDIVGGWIENVTIGETPTGARVGIVVNEEGKLIGLPFNRRLIGRGGSDMLVGTFFITSYNLEGDNVSLSEEMTAKIIKRFSGIEVYL